MFEVFKKIKDGFVNTHKKLWAGLLNPFRKSESFTSETLEKLEANLYGADFGPEVVEKIMQQVKNADPKHHSLHQLVRLTLETMLHDSEGTLPLAMQQPQVVLLLGVNGVGKTTTAAKLAYYLQTQNEKVLLGSCDTFRAAADQQLKRWAEQLHVECVRSHQGADAAAVAHDACQAGVHRNYNWILLDTAGRLHTKTYLVEELKKIIRVAKKFQDNFPQHKWLVIDGSLGTNSITQAKVFHEAIGLTGLIVTKLDGTSKGGAIVEIHDQLKLPIYFIGLGEACDDLQKFSYASYLDAIIGSPNGSSTC
ncbi:MAG: signal recognition particle-docking protein FtsY [Puniceicoccales bacterium]|jgi:fused signal recognition particle receptor|nr:signal recognition particle-docking protein FtsY [Puniceicoccales bacterium]